MRLTEEQMHTMHEIILKNAEGVEEMSRAQLIDSVFPSERTSNAVKVGLSYMIAAFDHNISTEKTCNMLDVFYGCAYAYMKSIKESQ